MITLPMQLSARWRLLGAEVAAVFAPLVAEINGKLGSEHFTPRAAIPNALKAQPRGVAGGQARYKEVSAPLPILMPCRVPQRAGDDLWLMDGLSLTVGGGGPISGNIIAPYIAGMGATVIPFAGVAPGAPFVWNGSLLEAGTNDFVPEVSINAVTAACQDIVLTVWFRTRHQR